MNETVRATKELDRVSLWYQVQFRPEEARELVFWLGNYNEATHERLENLIDQVGASIPPMCFGAGNPNNGKPHHKFRIGREYSRVIYLDIIKTYLPDTFDYSALVRSLKEIGRLAWANEAWPTEETDTHLEFRWWWD